MDPRPEPARPTPPPYDPSARLGGDVVSGEAVVLELRLAKLPTRMIAELLDLLVMGALLLVVGLVAGAAAGGVDGAAAAAITLVALVAVIVGYPLLLETLTRGRTLGKLAMGTGVVRDDGGPVVFRHALVRALVGVVEIFLTFGTVAILASLASARGKRLGDQFAGTVVVRQRVPGQGGPMAVMPPPLAHWASGLDLSRLPDDLALAARQFLARAPQLRADVRQQMGGRLAYDVSRFVAPPPPPGTWPETYLAAVLAERRGREEQRYARASGPAPGGWAPPPGWAPPVAPPVVRPGPPEDASDTVFAPPS